MRVCRCVVCYGSGGKERQFQWGIFYHNQCPKNKGAPLFAYCQSSYVAEVRAVAESLVKADNPTLIFCDCFSSVNQLDYYIKYRRKAKDHEIAGDLWDFIYSAIDHAFPEKWIRIKWIPGHLDSRSKSGKRAQPIRDGVYQWEDIEGNVEVDRIADAGAKRHQIPTGYHTHADLRKELTQSIQKHLARSWMLWCDLTREKSDDSPDGHDPPASVPLDFYDPAPECQGHYIDDWGNEQLWGSTL